MLLAAYDPTVDVSRESRLIRLFTILENGWGAIVQLNRLLCQADLRRVERRILELGN